MSELELRDKHDRERLDTILKQADRIEQLEAALREVAIYNANITKTISEALDQSSPPKASP